MLSTGLFMASSKLRSVDEKRSLAFTLQNDIQTVGEGILRRALLPVHEPCERVGSFVFKGRDEPVSVYRIQGG